MQHRAGRSCLCLLALLVPCDGHLRTSRTLHHRARLEALDWPALIEADVGGRAFWSLQWSSVEAELLGLRTAFGVAEGASGANWTQAANASNATAKSAWAGPQRVLAPSPADRARALALLKDYYAAGQERLAKLRAQEDRSERLFAAKQTNHEARLAKIASMGLSAGFRANKTQEENRFWAHWQQVRAWQHQQFDWVLEIQNATLAKEKAMIDGIEAVTAGRAGGRDVQKHLPEAADGDQQASALQASWKDMARFAQEALGEVRAAKAELKATAAA